MFPEVPIRVKIGFTGEDGIFHEIKRPPPPKLERCIFCEATFDINNLHPGHEKYFGKHPHVCRRCGFCFSPYGKIWSPDLEDRIVDAKAKAGFPRKCFICGNNYNLLGSFYEHMWYHDPATSGLLPHNNTPEWSYWFFDHGIDFLYPNLYVDICPECFQQMFSSHIDPNPEEQLAAVRELGEKIGKLPVKNFPSYIYCFHDKENIEWFLQLLRKLPDPDLVNARFGSYFQLLLKSGLLPEGTRRMRIGTWVKAKDGDLCFSLAERAIDDWLSKNGITHNKEVKYPESDMRCDWEVLINGKRVFIEYFGLMNLSAYKEKALRKKEIAEANGIKLIAIMPECDWELLLSEEFLS